MALITCTECGKEFSEKASACPNCGCPTEEILKELSIDTEEEKVEYENDEILTNLALEKGIIQNPDDLIISIGSYKENAFLFQYVGFVTKEACYFCQFDTGKKKRVEDIITRLDYDDPELVDKLKYSFTTNQLKGKKKIFGFSLSYIPVNKINKNGITDAYYEILKRANPNEAEFFYGAKYLNKPYCKKCHSFNIEYTLTPTSSSSSGRNEVRKKSVITRAGNSAGRAGMILATGGLWALTPKKSKYSEKTKTSTNISNSKFAICKDCGNSWKIL